MMAAQEESAGESGGVAHEAGMQQLHVQMDT